MIPFDEVRPEDRSRIGNKAFTLALLKQAGFNVPDGFVVPSDSPLTLDRDLLGRQLAGLKADTFAVRSSASNEDGERFTMAGQYRTHLGIRGINAVIESIEDCRTYRQAETSGIAVIVQILIDADVAGVMFTANPLDLNDTTLSIEAAWGLGETVVSGRVSPDQFRVRDEEIIRRNAATKHLRRSLSGDTPVPEIDQTRLCLNDDQVHELAALGRRVAASYDSQQDIEWAYCNDQLYLLQSRTITTSPLAERETIRQDVIAKLRAIAGTEGTVWARDSMAESLEHPTPMSWSILERLLAADGGRGMMLSSVGTMPDVKLGSQTEYDLVAGRVRMNIKRIESMALRQINLDYKIAKYKADPQPGIEYYLRFQNRWVWLKVPWILWRLHQIKRRQRKLYRELCNRFISEIVPTFREELRQVMAKPLTGLSNQQVIALLRSWVDKTCVALGQASLLITQFLHMEQTELSKRLEKAFDHETSTLLVNEFMRGAEIPIAFDVNRGLMAYMSGDLDQDSFLDRFGHRGPNEMELAQARWGERPDLLPLATVTEPRRDKPSFDEVWQQVQDRDGPSSLNRAAIRALVETVQTSVALREVAKDTFMYGYRFIRRCLLELDRRMGWTGGIFEIRLDELDQLESDVDWASRFEQQRRCRQIEASLHLPDIFHDEELERIGSREAWDSDSTTFHGEGISGISASGTALVQREPIGMPPPGPYVLVCPTSDPAWTPWFMNACAIVMERGGMLSHGAIVARELGIPAVANVPHAMERIRNGQRLRVDAQAGGVIILNDEASDASSDC